MMSMVSVASSIHRDAQVLISAALLPVHLALVNGGDRVGSAQPEPALTILENLVDAVARQALRHRVLRDLAVLVSKQTVIPRPEPQRSACTLKDRPHLLPCQGPCYLILHKTATVPMTETLVGADPDVAVMVFEETPRAAVTEAVLYRERPCPPGRDAADSLVRPDPHVAPTRLEKRSDEVVGQVPAGRLVQRSARCKVVGAAAVRADPQIVLAIAKDIPHHHPR